MSRHQQGYMLEVLVTEENGFRRHIGYMKGYFTSTYDAMMYYDTHNPHMRSLFANGDYSSDPDPETELSYVVRKNHCILPTLDCFDPVDNTEPGEAIKWLRPRPEDLIALGNMRVWQPKTVAEYIESVLY